jgi:hypothetical protein
VRIIRADGKDRSTSIVRGWSQYYCFCTGASDVFRRLELYIGDRI